MLTYELSLIILSLLVLVGTPTYVFFRNKMVRHQIVGKGGFTYRRVVTLTLTNIAVISTVYLFFQLMFISVLHFQFPTSSLSIFISILFLLTTGITFYGSGIYITSIVLEAYTLPHLTKVTAFKTQFIATRLFHGPISHFLIYSGFIFAFFLLAILELFSPYVLKPHLWVSLLGLPIGIIYALAQIYNKTYRYQLVVSLFCLAFFSILRTQIQHSGTLSMYFLLFSAALVTVLTTKYMKIKIKRYKKNRS